MHANVSRGTKHRKYIHCHEKNFNYIKYLKDVYVSFTTIVLEIIAGVSTNVNYG